MYARGGRRLTQKVVVWIDKQEQNGSQNVEKENILSIFYNYVYTMP